MEGDGDGDLIYSRLVSYTVLWCKSRYTRCNSGICGVYLHRAVYYTPDLYLSITCFGVWWSVVKRCCKSNMCLVSRAT